MLEKAATCQHPNVAVENTYPNFLFLIKKTSRTAREQVISVKTGQGRLTESFVALYQEERRRRQSPTLLCTLLSYLTVTASPQSIQGQTCDQSICTLQSWRSHELRTIFKVKLSLAFQTLLLSLLTWLFPFGLVLHFLMASCCSSMNLGFLPASPPHGPGLLGCNSCITISQTSPDTAFYTVIQYCHLILEWFHLSLLLSAIHALTHVSISWCSPNP